ncbi:MAG TPA: hypothetical protein VMW18_12100 [Candidatus Binatia bacterium]|nr:hypothetical protein [Candidatus Binatia bacterium]
MGRPAPVFLLLVHLPGSVSDATMERAEAHLESSERLELAKIGDLLTRTRRTLGRALLRRTLGHALGCAPWSLPLVRSPTGKPELPGRLAFSQARTGDSLAIAWSLQGPLGIDIELPEARFRDEVNRLVAQAMDAPLRASFGGGEAAPFQAWTAVEAIRKASGDGLDGLGFDEPSDPVRTGAPGAFRLIDLPDTPGVIGEQGPGGLRSWWLHPFQTRTAAVPGPSGDRGIAVPGCIAWPAPSVPAEREVVVTTLAAARVSGYLG